MSEPLEALKTLVAADETLKVRFAPGATDEAIDRLRAKHAVPEGLVALLRWADGNVRTAYAPVTYEVIQQEQSLFESGSALQLLGCDRILSTAEMWNEFAAEFRAMTPEEREARPHFSLWREDFIPFGASDNVCLVIAIEPCFGGPPGQIISFDSDTGSGWMIEHASLDGWLRLTTALLAMEREVATAGLQDVNVVRILRGGELERALAPERGGVDAPRPPTIDPSRFTLPKRRTYG